MKKFMMIIIAVLLFACNGKNPQMETNFKPDVMEQVSKLGLQEKVEHDKDGVIYDFIKDGILKKQFDGKILNHMHEAIVIVQGPGEIERVHKLVAYALINEMLKLYPPYTENDTTLFDIFKAEQNGFLIYQVEYAFEDKHLFELTEGGEPALSLASMKFLVNGDEIVALR